MDQLTIGEMAKLNGVSTQTLRLYDKMKLLEPARQDSFTGYRYYDIRQSAALDMIQYMKALGIPLKEIKIQLAEQDIEVVTNRLQQRMLEIEEQIETLEVTKTAVSSMVRGLQNYQNIPTQGVIFYEYLHERRVHSYPIQQDFAAQEGEKFEFLLREMKNEMLSKKLPISYFCNVGSSVAKDDFLNGCFISNKIFIWADDYSAKILPVEIFPAGLYLCVYFENFRNEVVYRNELLNIVKSSNYTIIGDYIGETIAEFPVFRKAERNTVVKIQVPVKME